MIALCRTSFRCSPSVSPSRLLTFFFFSYMRARQLFFPSRAQGCIKEGHSALRISGPIRTRHDPGRLKLSKNFKARASYEQRSERIPHELRIANCSQSLSITNNGSPVSVCGAQLRSPVASSHLSSIFRTNAPSVMHNETVQLNRGRRRKPQDCRHCRPDQQADAAGDCRFGLKPKSKRPQFHRSTAAYPISHGRPSN